MMSLRTLITVVALAGLLAACGGTITITPTPTPTPSASITAEGVTVEPVAGGSVSVPANSARWVKVTYPSNPAADLMYFEIGNAAGVRVDLYNETGSSRQLVSRSPSLFADRLSSLDSLSTVVGTAVDGASVRPGAYKCLGPCVATPYVASTRLVRLVNEGSSDRNNVELFAYGGLYDDLNEPNESADDPAVFTVESPGEGPTGALEHVNDRDFHRIQCGVGFTEPNLRLTLRASVFSGDVAMIAGGVTYRRDEPSNFLPCGSTVEVRTLDGTAASATYSSYSIVVD